MKPIVVRSAEGKRNKTVVEWAVIVALVGLACITGGMYVSTPFNAPEAVASASVSRSDAVETTGSIQSQKKHRAHARPRRRHSDARPFACPASVASKARCRDRVEPLKPSEF
jgi:Flp pilus assembly pilin Flp